MIFNNRQVKLYFLFTFSLLKQTCPKLDPQITSSNKEYKKGVNNRRESS